MKSEIRATKRRLSVVLAFALVLGIALLDLTPVPAFTASASTFYVNEDGKEAPARATAIDENTNPRLTGPTDGPAAPEDGTGWYVAQDSVKITDLVTVTGHVNLILADGCSLTAKKGVNVPENASLTIWGQAGGNGKLTATGDDSQAGIGGGQGEGNGPITIYGGTVEACGGTFGAGIGGGASSIGSSGGSSGGTGSNIFIYRGKVEAHGGSNAAGIGGGDGGDGDTITIEGNATVEAHGGDSGAGIGGGNMGDGDTITINGNADVTAEGGNYGAGIGGGSYGTGTDITIEGGKVEAHGGNYGAGIGGGWNGGGDTITIDGSADVTAEGGISGAGIGGGSHGTGTDITIEGGTVEAHGGSGGAGIGGGWNGGGTATFKGGVTIASSDEGAAIGCTPVVFDSGYFHVTCGSETNAKSDKVVESSVESRDDWSGLKWVKIQPAVTITFDGGGGDGDMPAVLAGTDDRYTLPECEFTPPDGMVFDCWTWGASRGEPGEKVRVTTDFTLKAAWKTALTPPEITTLTLPDGKVDTPYNQTLAATGDAPIIWDLLDNSSFPPGLTLDADGKISGTPATAGTYEFRVRAVNGGGHAVANLTITILPKNASTYTVTFNGNGGKGSMPAVTVSAGAVYELPECRFTPPDGMEFDCWYIGPTPGDVGKKIWVSSDITLKATWKPASASTPAAPEITTSALPAGTVNTSYTWLLTARGDAPITWDLSVGSFPPGLTLGADGKISGTPATAGTYTFRVIASNTAGASARDLTITVEPYSAPTYTITFNPNGGKVTPASGTTGANGKLAHLPTPTRALYAFRGWYTAATGGERVTADTVFTANRTIYAHWTYISVGDGFFRDPYDNSVPSASSVSGSPGSSPASSATAPGTAANNSSGGTGITGTVPYVANETPSIDWSERIELPEYAHSLYDALSAGSGGESLTQFLIDDDFFTIDPGMDSVQTNAEVMAVETMVTEETALFAGSGGTVFDLSQFFDEYNKVDVTRGDSSVDFTTLTAGDVVRNSTFNGVFVTKIPYDETTFDAKRNEICAYISTAYHAYDRDHPEIFWLSGKSMVRMLTASVNYGGATSREVFFFFVLADNNGFTLRSNEYQAPGAVNEGIVQRDAAVAAILATVDRTASRNDQVRALNEWLTKHNAYNSSADLTQIGNNPHECLSALVGNIGTVGPVCDGYSRAFKVLCDQLGIPCVLADGYARSSVNGGDGAHMWNNVQMDNGSWYGVDVTWNDPLIKGQASVAASGYENENYLLVGKDTVIGELTFGASHPETNLVTDGGVAFSSGLELSLVAYAPVAYTPSVYVPGAASLFADVAENSWYYQAVRFAYDRGLMSGTGKTTFAPEAATTRGMLATILARHAGEDTTGGAVWYEKGMSWAKAKGVSDGTNPDGSITREQLVAMLYRYAGSPVTESFLGGFSDADTISGWAKPALAWAVNNGIVSGKGNGVIDPAGNATRAEIAAILMRYIETIQ